MAEDRTVYKFEGDASGLIRAVKKASGAMDVAKKEAKKLDDELENVEHQAEKTAAGEVVLAGASLTAAGGMGALAAAASVAAVAVAAVAAVFAIVVVALAAVAAGFVAAAVGIHKMITAAGELYDELEPLYQLGALEPLPEDQIKAIKEYVKNWEALKVVFQDLLIAIAGNLAKDLESLSTEILVISIFLSDLVKQWLESASLIRTFVVKMMISPITTLALHLKGLAVLLLPFIKSAELLGIVSEGSFGKINGLIDDTRSMFRGLAEDFVDNGIDYMLEGLSEFIPDMTEARKKAEELKKGLKTLGKTAEETGEDVEEALNLDDINFLDSIPIVTNSLEDLAMQFGGIFSELSDGMSSLTDPTGLFKEIVGNMGSSLSDFGEAVAVLRKEVGTIPETFELLSQGFAQIMEDDQFNAFTGFLKSSAVLVESLGSAISSVIQQQIDMNDELSDKQKKNLKLLFGIQKAAALASIAMNTAAAIMEALKQLGPIAGGIAAGVITGIGAAQAATVLSQKPPFHVGGVIPAAPGDQGVMINALPGESVLTREATAGLGAEGVAALNSGAGMAGGVTVEMVYKHKIFDSFVSDNISKGGPLRNAIKSGRRVGHRSRG